MNDLRSSNPSGPVAPKWKATRRHVWAIVAAAALVILLTLVYQRAHRPLPPIEVAGSKLVLRDGKLFLTNGNSAFTGLMIERFTNGLLKSRTGVVDGRLQGVSEGWHANGQLQVVEHFAAGVSDGLRIKFYPSGQKQSEGRIVAGQFDGAYRRWHTNGQLAEQIEFRRGRPEGESLAYFKTGHLKTRATLRSGAVVEHRSWKDGELASPPAN